MLDMKLICGAIVAKRIKSLAQLLRAQITAQTQQPLISWLTKNYFYSKFIDTSSQLFQLYSASRPLDLQRNGDQICDHIIVFDNINMISKHLVELWFWKCTAYQFYIRQRLCDIENEFYSSCNQWTSPFQFIAAITYITYCWWHNFYIFKGRQLS